MRDPAEAARELEASTRPYLVGVRHHSPACAAAIPALLDSVSPSVLLLELPGEFEPWLEWLGHPEARAPLALAGGTPGREDLVFYPFADFSPELAAVRWARRHGVEVVAIDLPVALRGGAEEEPWRPADMPEAGSLVSGLLRQTGAEDTEELWDRLVEARAPGSGPEAVRKAALLAGWALRVEAALGDGIPGSDLRREAAMRAAIEAHPGRSKRPAVAVVGAFHAPALLREPLLYDGPEAGIAAGAREGVVTSLIPYAFDLLDSRSGYPAGIRDPLWQQRVLEALERGEPTDGVVADVATSACRALRGRGHAAGLPDAREASRMASDLARLRGLPSPGRREVLEALQSALAQGQLLGRGRALGAALDEVLVGRERGRLAPGTPRSGLATHVRCLLEELRLPGPETPVDPREPRKRIRLDPLRSDLDRRRHVALVRLSVSGVPYGAREVSSEAAGETLTVVWSLAWSPSADAALEVAGTRGVTLAQVAGGALGAEERRLEEEGRLTAAARLDLLEAAAECGLEDRVDQGLDEVAGSLPEIGTSLADLVRAHGLLERIARGHVPGLPRDSYARDLGPLGREILAACVRAVEGIAGSDRLEDALSLLELVRLFERQPPGGAELGAGRLLWSLERLAAEAAPLIQGAAGAALVAAGRLEPGTFGVRLGSWVAGATTPEALAALSRRLRGALAVAGILLEAMPSLLDPLAGEIEGMEDGAFLGRLPSLRDGFEVLSPAGRARLLEVLSERLGAGGQALELFDRGPGLLAQLAAADRAGRLAVENLFGPRPEREAGELAPGPPARGSRQGPERRIPPIDRWRLVLGREGEELAGDCRRMARALDDLYGSGRGEGSRRDSGGGREPSFPSTREWAEEIEDLFGEAVREEVLGRAARSGRSGALLELDPERVTPSVELLETVLSLGGALPEVRLGRLRRLVERCVAELTRELARRVRPALTGLATPRPTRRPRGPLDLGRTVRANLGTVRPDGSGGFSILPERLWFRTRGKRSVDWRVVLAVDVSGSMEPSTIHAALMAAILSGIPALSVNFLAFSTEVIDLSERAADPLALLLEIQVGGGTRIAKALRYARELVTVPARTIVVAVTDFEEGYSTGDLVSEVKDLVDSGVQALGLAALDDGGKPRYNRAVAEEVTQAGMPVAALTPLELARWIGERIR